MSIHPIQLTYNTETRQWVAQTGVSILDGNAFPTVWASGADPMEAAQKVGEVIDNRSYEGREAFAKDTQFKTFLAYSVGLEIACCLIKGCMPDELGMPELEDHFHDQFDSGVSPYEAMREMLALIDLHGVDAL